METRALCLMLLVLLAGSSGVAAEYIGLSPSQCQVPAKVRVDCGYPSVSKEECNNRGCCFDSSIRNVPWCFSPCRRQNAPFEAGQALGSGLCTLHTGCWWWSRAALIPALLSLLLPT